MSLFLEKALELVFGAALALLALYLDPFGWRAYMPDQLLLTFYYAIWSVLFIFAIWDFRRKLAKIYGWFPALLCALVLLAACYRIADYVASTLSSSTSSAENSAVVSSSTPRSSTETSTPQSGLKATAVVIEYHGYINRGQYAQAFALESVEYRENRTLQDFEAFWSPYRVGYAIYECDMNEVEIQRVFYLFSDFGYDFPLSGSEETLHISLVLNAAGNYLVKSAERISQTDPDCSFVSAFQAHDLGEE